MGRFSGELRPPQAPPFSTCATGSVSQNWLPWPTTLPYAITGIRLAASVALILTITGELVIGTPGIGREIEVAYTSSAVGTMYALVVVTGLVGVVANVGTRAVERRVLAWHPSVRQEVPV